MATLEERVAYLEGKVEEHSQGFIAIRDAIARLEERLDRGLETLDRRMDRLDDKMSRQFIWTIGIQITTLLAVTGAVLARA